MSTVTLWQWDLDAPGAGGLADRALLSQAERERADRFLVPHAARRFTAGRASVRRTLAGLRGGSASALPLGAGPAGKPFLPGGPEFNLSHSGPVALFAVAAFPLGVDVEAVRPLEHGVSRLVFTAAEQAYLAGLPEGARTAAFFRGWTRKEAMIKAQGGSLADLARTTVLPEPALPGWQVMDLPAPPGHAAALAAPGTGWTVIRPDPGSGAG